MLEKKIGVSFAREDLTRPGRCVSMFFFSFFNLFVLYDVIRTRGAISCFASRTVSVVFLLRSYSVPSFRLRTGRITIEKLVFQRLRGDAPASGRTADIFPYRCSYIYIYEHIRNTYV